VRHSKNFPASGSFIRPQTQAARCAPTAPNIPAAGTKFRHTLFSDNAAAVLGILGFTRDTVRRNLVCWCAPEACHGDVLLAMSLAEDLIRCQALRGSLWPAG
jgi:Domain of unknown function (DUF4326)